MCMFVSSCSAVTPRSIPVFPYHVVEGTTALLPCPLSLLLGEFITSYQYRWNTLGAGDTIEGVFLGSGLLPLMEVGEEIDVCSNASEDQRICRNVNGTLRISNVSSDDAQKRYRCVVNGFQRDGKQVVRFDQSAVSKPIPLVIISECSRPTVACGVWSCMGAELLRAHGLLSKLVIKSCSTE